MKDHQDAHRVFDNLCKLMEQEYDKVTKAEVTSNAELIALGTEVNYVIEAYNTEIVNLLKLADVGDTFVCVSILEMLHEIQGIATSIGMALNEIRERIDNIEVGKVAFIDMIGDKPKIRTWN